MVSRIRVPRPVLVSVLAATAAGVLVAAVSAGTVVGTARNDVLKGTLKNDKIYGKAGNDRMFGYAGNDVLTGGPGNDTLVGGPGADVLNCGPGRDVAQADAADRVNRDCETVKGLPKPPALAIADASTTEGDSATKVLSFPVTLSTASTKPVTVGFATADGTATAGSDYVAVSGTLTFSPGEKAKTVDVTITGETTLEPDEALAVNLSNPVNATMADGSATGTIQNDDHSPHPGHYVGATAQGYALNFDVASDGSSVTGISFTARTDCGTIGLQFPVTQLTGPYAVAPDRTFSASYSNKGLTVAFQGSFDTEAKASGTLKVDLVGETLNCSSGSVTWTAQ